MKEIEEELKRTEGNVSLPNQIENCKLYLLLYRTPGVLLPVFGCALLYICSNTPEFPAGRSDRPGCLVFVLLVVCFSE